MERNELIRAIQQYKDKDGLPYNAIKISGGVISLDKAPLKNLYGMYHSLNKRKAVKKEQQLEFNFIK